jgi:hypothetical protein
MRDTMWFSSIISQIHNIRNRRFRLFDAMINDPREHHAWKWKQHVGSRSQKRAISAYTCDMFWKIIQKWQAVCEAESVEYDRW